MAKAREITGLASSDAFAEAAAKVLSVRIQELSDHSHGVQRLDDIEPLHDMRVATRRLRSALEVFEACFPRKKYKAALREVKALADALGERRDRDVAIRSLTEFAARLPAPDRRGVASLVETLRSEQHRANEALGPYVADQRVGRLCRALQELVGDAG